MAWRVASLMKRTRRLLDHLLVAPLDRALALPEMEQVPVGIAQDLDLDVPRVLDELLDEDPVVAETAPGFIATGGESLEGLLITSGNAQALSTAAGAGLDHHGITDVTRDPDRLVGRLDRFVPARNRADTGLCGKRLRGDLVAHRRDRAMLGPDEDEALLFDLLRESRVLGQESIAGVDGLRPGLLRCSDDPLAHQIGLATGSRPDGHGFIGKLHVPGVLVGRGVDRDRPDVQPACGRDDPTGDLATVRDQDLAEQARSLSGAAHNGMFPCLRQGSSIFLFRSISSARQIRRRVPCGMITSSM